MTDINKIKVSFTTNAQQPKDSNGESFLFIGGREFRVNQVVPHGDKKPGKQDIITLGEGTNAEAPTFHDPRKPYGTAEPLTIEDVEKHPMWIRFDPVDGNDNWHLDFARVEVFAKGDADDRPTRKYEILGGSADKKVVLGKLFGLYVSLGPSTPPTPPPPV
jgi:hypothetical protein